MSSKAEQKAKQKIVEDKTFGLKNKNKSAKVSKYVTQLEQNILGPKQKSDDQAKLIKAKLKEEEEKKKAELAALFKPVLSQPKLPFGTDPKSVLCVFFKAGQCTKGDKCKYSHDLGIERKSAKIDVFTDTREIATGGKGDTGMENWTQQQLEEVVAKKHGGAGMKPSSEIVCKFFIDAVEQNKYGWFWECPNGGDKCQYRHALPPGYVLKRDAKSIKAAGEESEISLEEFLEVERHRIQSTATKPLTPVTEESFRVWKLERKAKSAEAEIARMKAKESEYKKGGGSQVSGKELFQFQPELFQDDDQEEALDLDYSQRTEDVEESTDNVTNQNLFLDEDIENLSLSDDE